jgi:hypothetical protein
VKYTNEFGERRDTLVSEITRVWTYLLVRADSTDPHTSNIIPLSAEMNDPVRTFVPQYVFVQAFDEEKLGSDIAFRRFLRNDNPPNTRIIAHIAGVPFINSVIPSGPATGIRMRWQGSDVIDYPTDAPPFEYQWKLFGPYTDDEYTELINRFRVTCFVSNDARVFKFGEPAEELGCDTVIDNGVTPPDTTITCDSLPTAMIICDTTFSGGAEIESCDTILIDTLQGSNVYGTLDTLLRVYDDDFIFGQFAASGDDCYRLADSSRDEFGNIWVTDERDTIYNSYWNAPADTTQAGTFLFVVRSRDDASVPDLTPAYRGFTVINPQHERDILVMNWTASGQENRALAPAIHDYWEGAINEWVTATGHTEVDFDPDQDLKHIEPYTQKNRMLKLILKYKVAIMIQDSELSGAWSGQGNPVQNTMVALQTGVNVWVSMRVPLGLFTSPGVPKSTLEASPMYQYYFGIRQTTYPGWSSHLLRVTPGYGIGVPRTEHFIGTLSLDPDQWPELAIDTALLRSRYLWEGSIDPLVFPFYPFLSEIGALPQVGWCVRSFDSEAMYLFKSKYGNEHGIYTDLSFHGRPVGIRLNRGLFRTVHYMFTPLALEPTSGQQMLNGVMNWLYDGRLDAAAAKRSNSHAVLSADLDNIYWKCYWEANGDKDLFYDLLENAY